jgi:DNA polymerase I-like protein with 3'-5' exonuclease and polymerase domains
MTILLHLGTPEDASYQYRLASVSAGQDVAWKTKLSTPTTVAEIDMACAAIPGGVQGIVCTNKVFLEKLLHIQPDYTPPNNRRGVTLDEYQGSLLHTPKGIPVVFLNPLENLVTQPYATPAAVRFISKLSKPASWYVATPFTWELGTVATLPGIYARWKESASLISIDIETIVGDPLRRINCVGFAAYFPATHTTECVVVPFNDLGNLAWVRKLCFLPQPKVFQNGLYDNVYLLRYNCPVYNWLYDTQHLFHSMFSEYPKRLDFISAFALRNIRYWKDDGKSGSIQDYYRYNARDCWATVNSFLSLLRDAKPYAIANYLQEFPLVFPCITCELEGIKVDTERMKLVKAAKEQAVVEKEANFRKMIASPTFNLNSPQQVKQLFKVCGLGHLASTDAANMLVAQASHPLNNRIFTELATIKKEKKLLSTYFAENKIWNGRLYYKLNPAGTDTGRLASAESSYWCGLQIQNIPRGDSVKQCLIADSGWLLSEIDKAQSEARCVGYLSGEEKLIELVEGPHDYHSWNAAAFFGVPYDQIYDEVTKKTLNKELRDLAKRTNHGANYNMGPGVMLATMGPAKVAHAKQILKLPSAWSLKEVCAYMLAVYAKTYPKIKGSWYDSIIAEVAKTGCLVSPTGWTRVFFGKPSRQNKPMLNAAVAHPPQNLSVAIINQEFYRVWRSQVYGSYYKDKKEVVCDLREKIRIKAQIHDSVFFQYRQEQPDLPQIVCGIMQTAVAVTAPDKVTRVMRIPSDISAGKSRWSELK